MGIAIDNLNQEMIDAGVRIFAGGLRPPAEAISLVANATGDQTVSEGAYLPGSEHVGGFWILECANLAEAQEWGRKAVRACRAPVEVRPFY